MLHSIFLRGGCRLPDRVDPPTEPFSDNWSHVERIEASNFDGLIRRAGWHFMWIQASCSRYGYGATEEKATYRALAGALRGVPRRFNAAEFNCLRITRVAGLFLANVTIEARQIQQNTSLDAVNENRPQPIAAT
jgi:hypothetical protein